MKKPVYFICAVFMTSMIFADESRDPESIIRNSNDLGLKLLKLGKFEMAEKTFVKAFGECNRSNRENPSDREIRDLATEVFNNLHLTWIKQGNYILVKEKLLQIIKQDDYGKSFTGILIYRSLANAFQSLAQYDSALAYAERAFSLAESLEDPLQAGMICTDIGTTYYYLGKYSEALRYFSKAREILLPTGDKPSLAKLLNNTASTYKQISLYEKATCYFFESAKLKEALADSDGLAATYNNLALVYFDWNNNGMTRHFLDKAIAINVKRDNKRYLATNYTALGDLCVDLKQADSALFYYRKSLELKTTLGNRYGIVISLHCLGDVYADMLDDESRAIRYYHEAFELADSIGAESEMAGLKLKLGKLAYKRGDVAGANSLFREALDYASSENSLEIIRESSRNLTEISIIGGDRTAAKDYFLKFTATTDTLYSEEKTKTILEMQTRFETEKKEQENLFLHKDIENQKQRISILFGFTILFLIMASVVFLLYWQKRVALKHIVRKNLEIVNAEKQLELQKATANKEVQSVSLSSISNVEDTTLGLIVKFNHLMKEEKPFLKPGLTVDDICRSINTNRSYLSQMIREHYGQNFNGYINELRIKEARRLLLDKAYIHISIEGIGAMSGFNNKVSFYSIFRKQIGVSPAYFRKSLGEIK